MAIVSRNRERVQDWPASPRLSQELPFRHPAPTPPSPSILSPFLAVGNGARFFYQRTQSILEVMAKLFANDSKRRQVHRGEAQEYSLKREDVNGLFRVLETAACDTNDGVALAVRPRLADAYRRHRTADTQVQDKECVNRVGPKHGRSALVSYHTNKHAF
ncbi:hypothetical protein DFH09DRAFT_1346076 [Mycena vulgaris]|nr:hypothetical protein DFH09DRAFT_1346076 [Mycena vulgaris]